MGLRVHKVQVSRRGFGRVSVAGGKVISVISPGNIHEIIA